MAPAAHRAEAPEKEAVEVAPRKDAMTPVSHPAAVPQGGKKALEAAPREEAMAAAQGAAARGTATAQMRGLPA